MCYPVGDQRLRRSNMSWMLKNGYKVQGGNSDVTEKSEGILKEMGLVSNPEITDYGTKIWRNKAGELHRVGGPAIESSYGTLSWWLFGIEFSEEQYQVCMDLPGKLFTGVI